METSAASFPPLLIGGKAFFLSPNTRFMVRGVALSSSEPQNGTNDLLADVNYGYMKETVIPLLLSLNVNMVRIYQVDLTHKHDKVMKLLEENSIWVMIGMVTPEICVDRIQPSYSLALYQRGTSVVDAFHQYPNTMAFSVGNEVVFPGTIYNFCYNAVYSACYTTLYKEDYAVACNLYYASYYQAAYSVLQAEHPDWPAPKLEAEAAKQAIAKLEAQADAQAVEQVTAQAVTNAVATELRCAAVMKSFIRDMKAYMSSKDYRAIPVGMAMQDGPQASVSPAGLIGTDVVAQFYASGPADSRADFIGINTYRYLAGTTPPQSCYVGLAAEVAGIPVPVFLTETGGQNGPPTCNFIDRDWLDVPQMYSNATLYNQLSGQVAFQLFEKGAGFGLYDQGTNQPTTWGVASDLAAQFSATEKITYGVPFPPLPSPNTSQAPANCNPALLPCPGANTIAITVKNYSTASTLVVIQSETTLATLPSATSSTTPSSTTVTIDSQLELYILNAVTGYPLVCSVPAGALSAGSTVSDNVDWGGVCNFTQG
jgi:hypothetical protein